MNGKEGAAHAGRTRLRALVVLALLAGTWTRLALDDLPALSPFDERVYYEAARPIAEQGPSAGLRETLATYVADPQRWIFPPPIRYGQHLAGALAVKLGGQRALATLSTLAGVATLVLATLLARRLAGAGAAALAAVLLLASPLALHLGRRALADAPYAAVALGAAWAFLEVTRPAARPRPAALALALALLTLQLAMKEGGALLLAALGVVHARRTGTDLRALARGGALLAGAALLAWLGFGALVGDLGAYGRVLACIRAAGAENVYLTAHQGGPPWRYLIDAGALSPLLVAATPLALAHAWQAGAATRRAALLGGLGGLVASYALILTAAGALAMGYNARYLLPIDGPARALVAVWLVAWVGRAPGPPAQARRRVVVVALALGNVLLEASVFRRVFVAAHVYDPTTDQLIDALWRAH